MAAPAIEALKTQLEELQSTYSARFAGQSRASRSVEEIQALADKAKALVSKIDALPKSAKDAEVDELRSEAQKAAELYTEEREHIRKAKESGPDAEDFAVLGTQANFVFARYRRHFAGKSRNTRDLGLLAEMVEDLTKIQNKMKTILDRNRNDPSMKEDFELVTNNLKLYVAERGEIVDSRNSGTPEEQADVLAEVANAQFKVYQDHFAGKSRLTRRPQLLQRVIDNLRQVKDRMQSLQKAGLTVDSNTRNIDIVEQNLKVYAAELAEIKKARAGVKLAELMGNLGGAANDVMAEYRDGFAGKPRKGRDLEHLTLLADQLGEIARQMSDLGRAEVNEMNIRNLGIVTDNLVMLETEYEEIAKANAS